jgi:hypothetical protein
MVPALRTRADWRGLPLQEDVMHQANIRDRTFSELSDITSGPDREKSADAQRHGNRNADETPQQRRARLRLLAICNDAEAYWDNVPV